MDNVSGLVANRTVLDEICGLNWSSLDREGISATAWAYYYFSIQFRENLEVANRLYPSDAMTRLVEGECDTDNLSPWPNIVMAGEKINHDEFMRRALCLSPIDPVLQARIEAAGAVYLAHTRAAPDEVKASSIASYEDGGLERMFTTILGCQHWDTPLLAAYQHFLVKHISFDSDPQEGHGALARHLGQDPRVERLWRELFTLFLIAAPSLAIGRHA